MLRKIIIKVRIDTTAALRRARVVFAVASRWHETREEWPVCRPSWPQDHLPVWNQFLRIHSGDGNNDEQRPNTYKLAKGHTTFPSAGIIPDTRGIKVVPQQDIFHGPAKKVPKQTSALSRTIVESEDEECEQELQIPHIQPKK
jgi:hypothetical protein